VWDLLERLVDKSLVMVDRRAAGVRYYLLETIRQYSRDRLFESGEAEAARDRHLAYYAGFAAEAERQTHGGWVFTGEGESDWVDRINSELDNLRAALEWGLKADPDAALQLAGDSAPQINYQGHIVEMRSWLEVALRGVQALPDAEGMALERRNRALSKAFFELGVADFGMGNLPLARRDFSQAIEKLAGRPVDYRLVRAKAWQAFVAANQGDPAARQLGDESLELAKQTEDLYAMNLSLNALEILALIQGETELSKSYLREREVIARGDPSQSAYVMVFFATAMTARARGEYEQARLNFQKCLPLFRRQKNRFFETVVLSELGHLARQMGDLDEARRAYCETMRLWQDLGHLAALTHQLETAAFIDIERGELKRAARLLGAAERRREVFKSEMRPYERQEYDAALESLRARLDPGELAERWQEGRELELDEAVQIAMTAVCA
jgi:tetratricopeptide (TPR) repeat protein